MRSLPCSGRVWGGWPESPWRAGPKVRSSAWFRVQPSDEERQHRMGGRVLDGLPQRSAEDRAGQSNVLCRSLRPRRRGGTCQVLEDAAVAARYMISAAQPCLSLNLVFQECFCASSLSPCSPSLRRRDHIRQSRPFRFVLSSTRRGATRMQFVTPDFPEAGG